jgi:hypothetical protein
MNRSRTALSRRAVLRGAGIALTLPWFESLATRAVKAQEQTPPKRFLPIYMPGGAAVEWWDITGSGASFQLSPLLAPFAAVKSKLHIIKNLGNYTWRRDLLLMDPPWHEYQTREDIGTLMPRGAYALPAHSRAPAAMLTCVDGDAVRDELGYDVATTAINAVTVDQVIAQSLTEGPATRSLQLGLLDGPGELDQRHSVMSRNMSWSDFDTPLGKELDTQRVFDALVAAGATAQGTTPDPAVVAAAAKRRALQQSALDSVTGSATSLKARLGTRDQAKLDEFLSGVRELELKINQVGTPPVAGCEPIADPGQVEDYDLKAEVMNDLIVMALQCDVTRVVSYMLDNSRSDLTYSHVPQRNFNEPGSPLTGATCGSYHGSQHAGLRNNDFASVCNWYVTKVADLAQKLDAVTEGEGTLLDHSLVMLFSDLHHGDHAGFDLPLVLLGSGGGTFKTDQYTILTENPEDSRQLRDLYFTILNQYFELGLASFGEDARGVPSALIEEILA